MSSVSWGRRHGHEVAFRNAKERIRPTAAYRRRLTGPHHDCHAPLDDGDRAGLMLL
jgi:hypothetical protein